MKIQKSDWEKKNVKEISYWVHRAQIHNPHVMKKERKEKRVIKALANSRASYM